MNLINRNIRKGVVLSGLLISVVFYTSCKLPQKAGNSNVIVSYTNHEDTSTESDTTRQSMIADSLFVAAQTQKIKGNVSEAMQLFKDFLKIKPDNAAASYELALLNGRLKNAIGTLQYARRAAMQDTTNSWYAIAYANALGMNKKYDSAAGIFHGLSILHPHLSQYQYNEAVMLSNAERYYDALQLFDSLEKREGVNEEFVFQKQRIYLKMNKPDSATQEIQKLIDLHPDNSRYYGLLAQVYVDNNQPDRAMEVYKTLLKKYPDNPQAMVAIGVYYKNIGDDSAYRYYMTQAFSNPHFNLRDKIEFVYPYLKYVEVDSAKKEEALFLCHLIVQAHPNEAAAHTIYGEMYFQCKQPESALMQFQQAIALDSTQYEPWNQMLLLYATGRNNDALLRTGTLATQRFPNEGGAWFFYGMANFFDGQFEHSIHALQKALSIGVKDKELKSRIYATMGEAYNSLGNFPLSDSCFKTSLQLNPDDHLTLNNFSYHLAERGQYLQQALLMIKTAVALQPDFDVYEDTYAWVLFKLGKYKEAREWMEKVFIHPDAKNHSGYLEHYGDILYKNHEIKKAVQYWQKAKAKGGHSTELNWKIRHEKLPRVKTKKRTY